MGLFREQPPSSQQPEQPGKDGDSGAQGGTGGRGQGPEWSAPPVHLDDTAKTLLPRQLDTTAFCQKYGLGDEICKLLIDEGYDTVNALFEEDVAQLEEVHLKTGHIAELKWAMKKMLLLEYPEIKLTDTKGEYATSIYGGQGGAGGDALERGGPGGTGKAPQMSFEDIWRFGVIGGGIGGAGGANGVKPGFIGTSEKAKVAATGVNTGPAPERTVKGGQGGVGGQGVELGGTGGVGGASKIPVLYVAFFKIIAGGIGGAGGYAIKEGGHGGVGEANIFPSLIFSIDVETRRRMPHTPLEQLEISENLCGLLQKHGFRTVGGLFEAYEQDLQPPDFKRGNIKVLKAELRKVAAQCV